MKSKIRLEPEALAFAKRTADPPYLFQDGPIKGRQLVDETQAGPAGSALVDREDRVIPAGPGGKVSVRIVRPRDVPTPLPVILYLHGAGWVFGNAHTHDRLISELAVRSRAAVVFPVYSLSPEVRYPTALEECYTTLRWVADQGRGIGLDPGRIAAAGDSVGGNLVAALTLLVKARGGPQLLRQLLFYPVTDAAFDTPSYQEFAVGYFLRRDAMMWFWDQYAPEGVDRSAITVSPLRASVQELRGLPPALVITAEADVLRDEGEAYANKLREAGVRVTAARFQGMIHDFVMLNALAGTAATRGAMTLAAEWLREGFEDRRGS